MKSVSLTAFPRTLSRRGGAKKLRAQARVPAVIYGRHTESKSLEVSLKELENLIHHSVSENLLLDLSVEGDAKPKRLALLQDVQHHPISGRVLHIDLHEVAEDEKVTVFVQVDTIGDAAGVKAGGGVLEHVLFKIKVRSLPQDLPEVITVDVTHLEIGQAIHLGEIKLPPGVEAVGDKHLSVIAVAAPITEAQEAAAETAAAPGELEVINEKKEDGATEGASKEKGAEKGVDKAADKGEKAEKTDKGEKKPEKKK
jgi:large subunit ribosomal protein L25